MTAAGGLRTAEWQSPEARVCGATQPGGIAARLAMVC